MRRVVLFSTATAEMSESDLMDMYDVAKSITAEHDITGLTIYYKKISATFVKVTRTRFQSLSFAPNNRHGTTISLLCQMVRSAIDGFPNGFWP